MSLHATPRGERFHIAFFGKRNAGKSSLINQVTGQELSIVSDVKGTTTDPVYKAMELLPLGPVMVIDTPGLDDEGLLGNKRKGKAKDVLHKTDLAIVVFDAEDAIRCASGRDAAEVYSVEQDVIRQLSERSIPYICLWNKYDLWLEATGQHPEYAAMEQTLLHPFSDFYVSATTGLHVHELKERMATFVPQSKPTRIIGDMLHPNDVVVLVVPIDESAPKGRLILPQQQTIRDVLDSHAVVMVTQEGELAETLGLLKDKPRMVVTDSQVFAKVAAVIPSDVPLTSFSILFARYKGELDALAAGVRAVENLADGDVVLMAEGCTHHRQCNDIGTVKIPTWLRERTKKDLRFETSSGTTYPDNLERYSLIVHCGACMLNPKEMHHRIQQAKEHNVPIVNYGVLIAHLKGVLERSLEPFGS